MSSLRAKADSVILFISDRLSMRLATFMVSAARPPSFSRTVSAAEWLTESAIRGLPTRRAARRRGGEAASRLPPSKVYFPAIRLATTGPACTPTRMLMQPRDGSAGSTGVALATDTAPSANWARRREWSGCHSGMLAAHM